MAIIYINDFQFNKKPLHWGSISQNRDSIEKLIGYYTNAF